MKPRRQQPARDRARAWLIRQLSCGPVTADALRFLAHKAGISWGTLQRARAGVVVSLRTGGLGSQGYWRWTMALAPDAKTISNERVCPVCGREGRAAP